MIDLAAMCGERLEKGEGGFVSAGRECTHVLKNETQTITRTEKKIVQSNKEREREGENGEGKRRAGQKDAQTRRRRAAG